MHFRNIFSKTVNTWTFFDAYGDYPSIIQKMLLWIIFQAYSIAKDLLIICFLSAPCSMQDLSSSTRDRTHAPCTGSPLLTTGLPE